MLSLNPNEFSHCQSGVLNVRISYQQSYYDWLCVCIYIYVATDGICVYIQIHTHTQITSISGLARSKGWHNFPWQKEQK